MLSSTIHISMFLDDGHGSPRCTTSHGRPRTRASRRGALELESSFGEDRPVQVDTLSVYRGWAFSDATATRQAARRLVRLTGEGLDCQSASGRYRHFDVTRGTGCYRAAAAKGMARSLRTSPLGSFYSHYSPPLSPR